ncbi:MAG: PKD domain-containing protein [candidate division WOR-3 bacterium]|nr:PKD domain-containing protein [candidate division WOR-3 bacterium]
MHKYFIPVILILTSALILGFWGCFRLTNPLGDYVPPVPSGPTRGIFNVIYDFKGTATHPDGESIRYQFFWGANANDTSEWSTLMPSGASVTFRHSWQVSSVTQYPIKYRVKDKDNNLSLWSDSLIFTIVTNNAAPLKPQIPFGPSSGVINTSYTFKALTTDPNGDSISYRFAWGDGDTSEWTNKYRSGDTASMSHTYTNSGTYFIKVQAKDELGALSEWSEELGITITSSVFPFTIALTWGQHPRDLDAHCWTPQAYHVYYANRGRLSTTPYCSLDVDDVTGYGPEHITISQLSPGTYKYAVHHYSGDSTIATSQAVVKVYRNGILTYTFTPPQTTCPTYCYWYVFNIDGATGNLTPVNIYTTTAPGPTDKSIKK